MSVKINSATYLEVPIIKIKGELKIHSELLNLKKQYDKLVEDIRQGFITPEEGLITLRALSVMDQEGWNWVINENGDFLRSKLGTSYQFADPELFIDHRVLDESEFIKSPKVGLKSDKVPIKNRIKIRKRVPRSKLPELNLLENIHFSNFRTVFIVFLSIFIALTSLLLGQSYQGKVIPPKKVSFDINNYEIKDKKLKERLDKTIAKYEQLNVEEISCINLKCKYRVLDKDNKLVITFVSENSEITEVIDA